MVLPGVIIDSNVSQIMSTLRNTFTLALFTAVGAAGVNQRIPKVISQLWDGEELRHKVVQFILLWVLIMQGGGGMQIFYSFIVAAIYFGVMEFLLHREDAALEKAAVEE